MNKKVIFAKCTIDSITVEKIRPTRLTVTKLLDMLEGGCFWDILYIKHWTNVYNYYITYKIAYALFIKIQRFIDC